MEPLYNDPQLQPIIDEHGELSLEPAEDPYQRLVVSIINQQLSTQSAAAIRDRLFNQFDITPETMLDAEQERLRELGLSHQKIEYIQHAAEHFLAEELSPARFQDMPDEQVIDQLTQIKGIGVWTAKMFLMFVLAREDVFPVEDLGVRHGMQQLYSIEERPAMIEKAEDWRPYRSIASMYLWKVTDANPNE